MMFKSNDIRPNTVWRRNDLFTAALTGLFSCLCLLATSAVHADSKFKPTLGAQYSYLSNVYSLPSDGSARSTPDGRLARGDHAIDLYAGFADDLDFGRQLFSVDIRFNHLKYVLFTQLDHNEYTGDAILKWKIGSIFDGTLGYSQEQSMVSFNALADPQALPASTLLLETSKTGTVTANVQMTPIWRLESGIIVHTLHSPRPDENNNQILNDLVLKENTGKLALRNTSKSHLSFGIDTAFVDGKYDHTAQGQNQNPDYKQASYQLAADYVVSGLSSFNAAAGYTSRKQQGNNLVGNGDVSAVTGRLGYTRKITPKTSIDLQISRAVNSYLSNVSSEIDSGVTLALNWQATAKISNEFHYGWTNSDFPNELVPSSTTDKRLDHSQFVAYELKYQALRTVMLKPFARYENRDSNISFLKYHGTTIGLELVGSWQ